MLPVPEGPFLVGELFAARFVVLAAPESEIARRGRPLSIRQLAELPLIAAHRCRYMSELELQLRERGFEPTIAHRSDDNGTVQGLGRCRCGSRSGTAAPGRRSQPRARGSRARGATAATPDSARVPRRSPPAGRARALLRGGCGDLR